MTLRLMAIFAHPDDETLGFGGTLAAADTRGFETYVLTATRGQKGWFGPPDDNPGPDELGRIRERELRDATAVLGVRETIVLDYMDGELRDADPDEVVRKIARQVRRLKPDVVVTFGHDGIYGQPDHIAISQFATAAVVAAADAGYDLPVAPHRVSKLYYRVTSAEYLKLYEKAFGDLVMEIDGVERRGEGWPEWAITTVLDTRTEWRRVWDAVRCHMTQLPLYERLAALPDEHHVAMWGTQEFYRVFTLVPPAPRETDLFDGLRVAALA
jgi:LmbE family N-acetylglucosaminyl deacetylase